jgi:hypothetical protein
MASNREIACQYYMYEGGCSKGRKGTFYKSCQTCKKYVAVKGGEPARKNLKRQKIQAARKRDSYDY